MLLFLILGRYDEVWEALEKPMCIYFILGIFLVLVSLNRLGGRAVWGFSQAEDSARQTSSLAFDIRGLLQFWPVLFALSYTQAKTNFWRIIGLSMPLINIIFQIFTFKFRSTIGLCLLQVAMVVLVLPVVQKRLKLLPIFVIGLSLLIAYFIVKDSYAYESFTQRFEERDKFKFRSLEGQAMLSQLGPLGTLIGNGIGGWYLPPFGSGLFLIRSETHVGVLFPILKGGFLFSFVLLTLVLRCLLPKPTGWYNNRYNITALSVLPVFVFSQLIIPFPTVPLHLEIILAALAIARMGTPVYDNSWEYTSGQYLEYEYNYGT
jgi:hypothetical protein